MLDELKSIPAGDFEAVDASRLTVSPDSAQVRGRAPPTTAASRSTSPSTAGTRAPAPATATSTTSSTAAPLTVASTAPPTTLAGTTTTLALAAGRLGRHRRAAPGWPWIAGLALMATTTGASSGVVIRRRRRAAQRNELDVAGARPSIPRRPKTSGRQVPTTRHASPEGAEPGELF